MCCFKPECALRVRTVFMVYRESDRRRADRVSCRYRSELWPLSNSGSAGAETMTPEPVTGADAEPETTVDIASVSQPSESRVNTKTSSQRARHALTQLLTPCIGQSSSNHSLNSSSNSLALRRTLHYWTFKLKQVFIMIILKHIVML